MQQSATDLRMTSSSLKGWLQIFRIKPAFVHEISLPLPAPAVSIICIEE
jgi:hypothetical protein